MRKRCGLCGLALWVAGVAVIATALRWNVRTEAVTLTLADGTPIHGTLFERTGSQTPLAIAVVVHGVAQGHRSCVPSLAIPLAQEGFLTLGIDLRGHGRSGGALPHHVIDDALNQPSAPGEYPEVEAAITFLRGHPRAPKKHPYLTGSVHGDRQYLVLLGHSLGGWIAANVGFQRPDVDGVVSIGAAPGRCDLDRPHNFLLVSGKLDPLLSPEKCASAIARATGDAADNVEKGVGRFDQGTARRLIRVNEVDHLTELASPAVTRNILLWAESSLNYQAGPIVLTPLIAVIAGVCVAIVGGIAACIWGLGCLLPNSKSEIRNPKQIRNPNHETRGLDFGISGFEFVSDFGFRISDLITVLALLVALVGVAPLSAALSAPLEIGPVYGAIPSVALLTAAGAVSLFVALARRRVGCVAPAHRDRRAVRHGLVLGVVALALGGACFGVPWGMTWADLVPTPRRLRLAMLLTPFLLPGCLALAAGLERLLGGGVGWRVRLTAGALWLVVPMLLWLGYLLAAAERWPLFIVPVGLLSATFLVPLPLWLLPSRRGLCLARGLCHAGAAAWLLGCQLPFVEAVH
jgi:pimeloyl-ACP methyl ester carboxylesterase